MGILSSRINPKKFYAESLSEAERERLPVARKMEGLAEEIAVLRVRLNTALHEHKGDFPLLMAGIGMLVRAVATQYRLSPKARKELADQMTAVLNSLGDQILPPDR
ncbi:MAG TPA: hypothetical protein VMT90_07670 [Dehalococcoidia bacterium]|nr:hypothetical protein [Dehalococcoidia bacterium]